MAQDRLESVVAGRINAGHFVFVDECGAHTLLAPLLHAWSHKGERARFKVPRNREANITLLASVSLRGMGPCLAVEGSMTREAFEAYQERLLVPALRLGQVMVTGNPSSHKGSRVRQLIEARGCDLMQLPALLAGSHPIEEAFSKVKALLRSSAARTREALAQAMGAALNAITAQDACGSFADRSYRILARLL